MRYSVHFNKREDDLLRQMAKEAGVGTYDIIEIAAYNLMALWLKERGEKSAVPPGDMVDVVESSPGVFDVPVK